ncbi:unnamed protein product, partial [marine sediment metagenome]
MSNPVSIEMSQADIDSTNRLITALQKQAGKDIAGAVAWAGYYICRSLGAITRKSKKYRKEMITTLGTDGIDELATRVG